MVELDEAEKSLDRTDAGIDALNKLSVIMPIFTRRLQVTKTRARFMDPGKTDLEYCLDLDLLRSCDTL